MIPEPLRAALAAAAGDDPTLVAELRAVFLDSAEALADLLRRVALRRQLAGGGVAAARAGGQLRRGRADGARPRRRRGAPGDPVALRRIATAIAPSTADRRARSRRASGFASGRATGLSPIGDEGMRRGAGRADSACRAIDDAASDGCCARRCRSPARTLVEHQARLAAAAGAGPIILLVERMPAALTAAVDRLRRDGLRVEVARGLADAVDRIHPDEALLVLADGCVAEPRAPRADRRGARAGGADRARRCRPCALRADRRGRALGRHAADRRRPAAPDGGDARRMGSRIDAAAPRGAGRRGARSPPMRTGDGAARDRRDGGGAGRRSTARSSPPRARPAADWPARFLFPPIVDLSALPLLRRGRRSALAGGGGGGAGAAGGAVRAATGCAGRR